MAGKFTTALGKVEISDSVIAIIAGTAASECYGLVGMAARNVQDGLIDLLRQEHYE
ncbi:MAG: Asp23/Gls24 family envelope stress response protein, partial [Firmicutes bacterium]|nr:Asp23/Gls24 family envelope stress response protein [Bacillota bacterium]